MCTHARIYFSLFKTLLESLLVIWPCQSLATSELSYIRPNNNCILSNKIEKQHAKWRDALFREKRQFQDKDYLPVEKIQRYQLCRVFLLRCSNHAESKRSTARHHDDMVELDLSSLHSMDRTGQWFNVRCLPSRNVFWNLKRTKRKVQRSARVRMALVKILM